MLTFLRRIPLLTALIVALGVVPALAQTTVTSTTLSSAITATQTRFTVASATDLSVGYILFVEREAMRVEAVSSTTVTVQRGILGTPARAHGAAAIVYHGANGEFAQTEVVPGSVCTSTAEAALPRIVLPTGNVYQCTNSIWYRITDEVGTIQASFVQGATPANALDTVFFLADRDYVVTAVSAMWGTAETTGSMDIMVEKLTGTTACASGTDLLSAAIAGTGTANTVTAGALVTTAASHLLAAGNRLCVDLSATPNEVANMVVTVTLVPR